MKYFQLHHLNSCCWYAGHMFLIWLRLFHHTFIFLWKTRSSPGDELWCTFPITGLSIKLNNRVCVWFDPSKNLSQCRLRTDWEVSVKQRTQVYYDFGKILLLNGGAIFDLKAETLMFHTENTLVRLSKIWNFLKLCLISLSVWRCLMCTLKCNAHSLFTRACFPFPNPSKSQFQLHHQNNSSKNCYTLW